MRRNWIVFCGIGCMLGASLWLSCKTTEDDGPPVGMPTEAQQAAQILLSNLAFPDTAEVFLVGPVAGGTELREKNTDTTRIPIVLTVPDTISGAYAFFINDHHKMMYAHTVRYAWVQPSTGRWGSALAQWEPTLIESGISPSPFTEIAQDRYNGMIFRFGHGGGAWRDDGDAIKPNADSLAPLLTSLSLDAPCKKKALVIDCGADVSGWKSSGSASEMAENAGLAQSFLENNGFSVQRISQDPSNSLPGFKPTPPTAMYQLFRGVLQQIAADFSCPCEGDPPCHEFFLYVCAHGGEGRFELNRYDAPGGGNIEYSNLYSWLNAFPPCVKIIVFLDICHAGSAQPELEPLCNSRADCGFTLICSCGSADETPAGFIVDSGTEDWAQGTDDQDNDGKEGDLGDRWLNLEDDNSGNHPQRYLCPGQTRMCSTD